MKDHDQIIVFNFEMVKMIIKKLILMILHQIMATFPCCNGEILG